MPKLTDAGCLLVPMGRETWRSALWFMIGAEIVANSMQMLAMNRRATPSLVSISDCY